jgi:16S rRNA processing protein RimM
MTHENEKLILVAKIGAPHGIKGMVKIISYMQIAEDIFNYKIITNEAKFVQIESHKAINASTFICKIKDIDDRNKAEEIKGLQLFINKAELPELSRDEFYVEDLKGRQVINLAGEIIGLINNVHNFGASDIIEIKFNNGAVEMFDFNSKIFPKIEDKVTFIAPLII